MKLFVNGENIDSLRGYVFCDADFLTILFKNKDFLEGVLPLFSEKFLVVDPLTKLEFLRDVYAPEQRILKEQFISKIFLTAEYHQEIFRALDTNALILSRIYAHRKRPGASLVDLFLAARLMRLSKNATLITGNAKDFPSFIFDTLSIINFEEKDGVVRAIPLLRFNEDKFKQCQLDYSKMKI